MEEGGELLVDLFFDLFDFGEALLLDGGAVWEFTQVVEFGSELDGAVLDGVV